MQLDIQGTLSQFVDLHLGPAEEVYADPGTLVCKDANLQMDMRLMGGLGGGLKRVLAGSGLYLVYFTGPGHVLLSKNRSGKIIELNLEEGDEIEAHAGSLLMAERSVELDLITQDVQTGLFGGHGLFWARLRGTGRAFLQTWGDHHTMDLGEGEAVQINAGRLVYKSKTVTRVPGNVSVRGALFGGLGAFFITVIGPGRICLQSRTRSAASAGSTRIDVKRPSKGAPPPQA